MVKICVVIPCYNEEKVLRETSKRLKTKMASLMDSGVISGDSKVLYVDDRSGDSTWDIIEELALADDLFSGIRLSRNRGQQIALLAGLMEAREGFDAVITMDADLQDDIDKMDDFIENFVGGYDVVYGVRSSRAKDSFVKRFTAESFYKMLKAMDVDIVFNHADYRLMSRRVLDGLAEHGEQTIFLRGLLPTIGYKTSIVEYERHERFAGETKYPFGKMMRLAIDGITSSGTKPLKLIFRTGVCITIFSFAALICLLVLSLLAVAVPGWVDAVAAVWLLGGILLSAMGIMGEYLGKVYAEAKGRPRYFVSDVARGDSKRDKK